MSLLSGKNALVTGGLGGIGQEICKQLLKAGVENLTIVDILPELEAQKKIDSLFDTKNVVYRKCFVDQTPELESTLTAAVAQFGQLDILINCAAIADDRDVNRTLVVNAGAVMNASLFAIGLMRKDKGGRGGFIVNISSIAGLNPFPSFPIYCASKFAIVGFTRSLAANKICEQAGVKICLICPHATDTPMLWTSNQNPLLSDHDEHEPQSPAVVGECVIKALEENQNETIWICAQGESHKADMKFYE